MASSSTYPWSQFHHLSEIYPHSLLYKTLAIFLYQHTSKTNISIYHSTRSWPSFKNSVSSPCSYSLSPFLLQKQPLSTSETTVASLSGLPPSPEVASGSTEAKLGLSTSTQARMGLAFGHERAATSTEPDVADAKPVTVGESDNAPPMDNLPTHSPNTHSTSTTT